MREWLSIYLKGMFMGASDAVPGVSGGTIALITGIYDRLISAIAAADPRVLADLLRPHDAESRSRVAETLVEMDLPFLLTLGAGIATAIVTVARVVSVALAEYPAYTFAFFFGLIAASAIVLYEHVDVTTPRRLAVAAFGFVLAVVVSLAPFAETGHAPLVVFFSGALAVSAMVLPGISGSLILLIIGQYEFMLDALDAFVTNVFGLLNGGTFQAVLDSAVVVVTFIAGAVVGLLTITHAIKWAFAHYRSATLTFLVSLMVGALAKPVSEILAETNAWTAPTVSLLVVLAVVGGGAVLLLNRYTLDLEY
ncbi:DUF368 domain-containing protein [Halobacteriaceae archaeon GCM10025711]